MAVLSALTLLAAVAAYEVLGMGLTLLFIRRWITHDQKRGQS